LARLGVESLSADGEWTPASTGASWDPSFAMYSFGAIFAEVRVDEEIPIPRVSRVVGVYNAAGSSTRRRRGAR
jgi:xanthine dehydrogenase YagR molybdenum-binding subunit